MLGRRGRAVVRGYSKSLRLALPEFVIINNAVVVEALELAQSFLVDGVGSHERLGADVRRRRTLSSRFLFGLLRAFLRRLLRFYFSFDDGRALLPVRPVLFRERLPHLAEFRDDLLAALARREALHSIHPCGDFGAVLITKMEVARHLRHLVALLTLVAVLFVVVVQGVVLDGADVHVVCHRSGLRGALF